MIEWYIAVMDYVSPIFSKVPGVVWLVVPGLFTQWIIGFLHRPKPLKEGEVPPPPKPSKTALERYRDANLLRKERGTAAGTAAKKDQ